MSPTVGSKIPRKAPTLGSLPKGSKNVSGTASPRSVLPQPRGRGRPVGTSPLGRPTAGSNPGSPANVDKPLPSPPVAQVVNPMSPVKAQRTLVDATVAGTPPGEDWPVIRPENVSPASAAKFEHDDADNEPANSMESPVSVPTSSDAYNGAVRTTNARLEGASKPAELARMTGPLQAPGFLESPSDRAHAISTPHGRALDSPLARRQSSHRNGKTLSRGSSQRTKRSSLPLPNKSSTTTGIHTPTSRPRPRPAKPGSTKWPLLDAQSPSASAPLPSADSANNDNTAHVSPPTGEIEAHHMSESAGTFHTSLSQQMSLESTSTWSMSGASSFGREPEQGLGPVLTIADDADAFLLGNRNSAPGVSPLPDTMPQKMPREHSLSALAGRISRQTMSKMSLSKGPRSATPHSSEIEVNESSSLRIKPIRSMQPPRGGSTESDARNSSCFSLEVSQEPVKISHRPESPRIVKRDVTEPLQNKVVPEFQADLENPYSWQDSPHLPDEDSKNGPDKQSQLSPQVPPKADQVLGISMGSPLSSIRSPLQSTRGSPVYGSSKMRKTITNRSNTSSSMIPSARHDSRIPSVGPASTSPRSFFSSQVTGSRNDGHRAGPSKLRSTESATPDRNISTAEHRRLPNVNVERQMQRSRLETTISSLHSKDSKDSKKTDNSAAKIKAKRSFRDFFHKRDGKRTMNSSREAESKRSSITMTGSTLAKRLRNSANFSKTTLPREPELKHPLEPKPELMKTPAPNQGSDSVSSSSEPSSSPREAPSATQSGTSVVNKIIDRVKALPKDSPDRLRGLEIAEVCQALHCRALVMKDLVLTVKMKQALMDAVETVKQAGISVQESKKHARDAELCYHAAYLRLQRLEKLIEPDFDEETLQIIKELIRGVGPDASKQQAEATTSSGPSG